MDVECKFIYNLIFYSQTLCYGFLYELIFSHHL